MTYHSGGMVDAVAGIAHRAITDRLGYEMPDAVIGITTPDPESGAVILHVNSGGNALACGEDLRGRPAVGRIPRRADALRRPRGVDASVPVARNWRLAAS